MPDRAARPEAEPSGTEIEVTPTMLLAGLEAWWAWQDAEDASAEDLVNSIYLAMQRATPKVDDPQRTGPVIDPIDDARIALGIMWDYVQSIALPDTLPAPDHAGLRATERAEQMITAIDALVNSRR